MASSIPSNVPEDSQEVHQHIKITDEISDVLKSYVYLYIDPRNGEVFYIGKGKGNRLFAHLDDRSDSEKAARIADIRSGGHEPQIDFLRFGLSDTEASLVEATAIDLIGKGNLTNRVSGLHSRSYGRITSQELLAILKAKPVMVRHKALLITINRLYRSNMTTVELYEATRGVWKIGLRREQLDYAMALYQGVVKEVYRIDQWHPAGTLEYQTRDNSTLNINGRWEFSGNVAQEIRAIYVGNSVGKGGQNPVRYINV